MSRSMGTKRAAMRDQTAGRRDCSNRLAKSESKPDRLQAAGHGAQELPTRQSRRRQLKGVPRQERPGLPGHCVKRLCRGGRGMRRQRPSVETGRGLRPLPESNIECCKTPGQEPQFQSHFTRGPKSTPDPGQRQSEVQGRHHATALPEPLAHLFPLRPRRRTSRHVNAMAAASKPAAQRPLTLRPKPWVCRPTNLAAADQI